MGHETVVTVQLKINPILGGTLLTALPYLDLSDNQNIASAPQCFS